jgi:hypothetical protein
MLWGTCRGHHPYLLTSIEATEVIGAAPRYEGTDVRVPERNRVAAEDVVFWRCDAAGCRLIRWSFLS